MRITRPSAFLQLLIEIVAFTGLGELVILMLMRQMDVSPRSTLGAGLNAGLLMVWVLPFLAWRLHRYARELHARRAPTDAAPRAALPMQKMRLGALLFMVLGSGISLFLAHGILDQTQAKGRQQFSELAELTEQAIIDQFQLPLLALRSLEGIHAMDYGFSRDRFRAYWTQRGFQRDFPGVRGFGYIVHVPDNRLDFFLDSERRDQAPDFDIKVLGPTTERYVIKLIEPYEPNRAAIGLDIGSEPVRRQAAEAAIFTGQARLTGVISLVQDGRQGPGFLLLLPVFHPRADTDSVAARREHHIGFVYSPLVAAELFAAVLPRTQGQLEFLLTASTLDAAQQPVFVSPHWGNPEPSQFELQRDFRFAGISFRLQARSTEAFESLHPDSLAWQVGLGGSVLSAMLAFVIWLLASGRARAEALAHELTGELREMAAVARNTNDSVIITDNAGRITWANEGFTRLTGYQVEEVQGRNPDQLLQCAETDPLVGVLLQEHKRRRESARVDILNRRRNGSTFWVDLEIQPLNDETGLAIGYMSVARDISALRDAQEREQERLQQLNAALRESESLMSTIMTHAIVSEAGPDGRITRVNEAFCEISGYSREELLGQNHRMIKSAEQGPEFWADMWHTISSGRPWRGKICNRAKDGRLYWVDSLIAPFMDANGRVEKYIAIRFDITQARMNEAELARERLRLQSTLEGTGVGTWELNLLTGENRIDHRYAGMLGYGVHELTPLTSERWQELIHPEDHELAISRMRDYVSGRVGVHEVEFRLRHKQGHWIWVLSRGIATSRLADGRVEWMSGTQMDVTERHRLQQEVQQRNDLMSAIIENLPGGLSVFDADLNLILRNSKFGQLLQLPEELLSRQPTTFESIIRFNAERGEYGSDDQDQIVAMIVERARHPVAHVMERTRPDGSTLEVRGLPLPGGGFVSTYTDITQRKQLEQTLRASEEMLERTGQVAGIGGWSLDLRGNVLRWSQQTRRIHEVGPDFVPTLDHAVAFYPPDAREEITRLFTRAMREGEGFDAELPLVTATGREIWVRAAGAAEIVDGEVVRLIGAFQEITDRRALEQRVRDQNQILTAVLENMPGGLVAFDAHRTMIMRNRQFGTLLNFPDDIFQQQPLHYETLIRNEAERGEFGPGDVEEIVAKAVSNFRQTRESTFERVRPNGQTLEVRIQPMGDGGVLFMIIDITRRKTAEREARQADEMLRQAINTLDEAFVIYDEQDRLLICNQRYRDTYPVAAEVMVPGNSFEYIIRYGAERGEYPAAVDRVDEWVAERLRQHQRADTDLVQELGSGRYLRIVERKTPSGFIVGFRIDISDLVRARLAAEEASKSKSQFLANMSHEIRTPMNAVLGMLQLLQNTDLTPRQLDYVSKTEGAARSLLGLLNDILDFSKVEAGKMTLESAPFGMEQLLRDLSVILTASLGGKPVELLFDLPDKLPDELTGDSLRLKQILINLGGNAIKFTERGMVTLCIRVCERRGDVITLEFSVADTGIGIAPEHQRQIFEGFTQAEASTTRRYGGTGLGLAISARLVELMGGQLQLESEPGHGSRFFFRIDLKIPQEMPSQRPAGEQSLIDADLIKPVTPAMLTDAAQEARRQQAGPQDRAPGSPAPSRLRLQGMRILLVEDNRLNQQVAQELLQREGAVVTLADDGAKGLQALLESPAAWDVVLMDVQMPVMDGYTATRQARLHAPLAQLPIIAMTANAMESDRREAMAAGMNAHVGKPFNVDDLVMTILAHTSPAPSTDATDVAPSAAPVAGRSSATPRMTMPDNTPELDIAAAAERLGDDLGMLYRVLHSFSRELPATGPELEQLLHSNQFLDASRLMHTLKGTAATIGAMRLSAVAARIELRLRNAPHPDVQESAQLVAEIGSLAAAVATDVQQVLQALQPPDTSDPTDVPLDAALLCEDLEHLLLLLRNSDLASLEMFESLRRRHEPALAEQLAPLADAMAGLDFAQAVQLCEALQARYTS